MVFCPDYGSIQSHYHQIVIQINQAVNRAKTQGQEPTNPVIEWYFNNSLAPQEDNSDTSEKQEIKVLFVKKPTQYALWLGINKLTSLWSLANILQVAISHL